MYKFRLYPTAKQEADMVTLLDRLRYFYNAALQERRDGYKAGVRVDLKTQSRAIPIIKADPECSDYHSVNAHVMQSVLHKLDFAFQAFFRSMKGGTRKGYPRFKGPTRFNHIFYKDAATGRGAKVVSGGARLRLHGIGNVKMKQHREMEGKLKTIGVTRDKCGHWHATITREVAAKPLPATGQSVGIDLGLTTFAALSDGAMIANPRPGEAARVRIERASRVLCRRKRGSKRRRKARLLFAKAHAHVANVRRDFHHKTARAIVQKYDRIAIEDLNVKGLADSMLARAIRDAGWSQFASFLTSKAEDAGREAVRVDPNGTSQECSGCGERVPKALSVRVHDCPHCGLRVDRDVNAARNIHDRAFAVTGPGRGLRGGALQQQTPAIREAAA